jgi:hypothetical protein
MKPSALVLSAVFCFGGAQPILAQDDVCYLRVQGQWTVDPKGTQAWLEAVKRQDPEVMLAMNGVWYGELVDPASGAVSYQFKQYDESGGFAYQSRTCSTAGFCSDNTGTGYYTGMKIGDGSISLFVIVSDLERDHECTGGYARLVDANRMEDAFGMIWQKVQ